MSLIIFHELGHLITGIVFNWKIDKIYIYPLGGVTKFNTDINKTAIEEFLVTIMGPLFQILLFLLIKDFDESIYNFNKLLLFINLLPIVPLDGSKITNIIFSLIIPFKKNLYIQIIISYIAYFFIILFFLLYINSFYMMIVISLLIFKIIEEKNKINYVYTKFLMERYLKKYRFKKNIIISHISKFFKYRNHQIIINNHLYSEYDILKKYFNNQ